MRTPHLNKMLLMLVTFAVGAAVLAWANRDQTGLDQEGGAADSSPVAEPRIDVPTGPSNVTREMVQNLLGQVEVVAERPSAPGYDRECGSAHSCSFGQAWTDDTAAALGHDGCDTRNNMLAASLQDPAFREGTHRCVVVAGQLLDPYTGATIAFAKDRAHEVGVDHMVPLARAWDLGASRWDLERRKTFANDPHNLVVVSGPANSSKSDRGPGEWMPINGGYRCTYIHRYLEVSIAYGLPVTRADHQAIASTARSCS